MEQRRVPLIRIQLKSTNQSKAGPGTQAKQVRTKGETVRPSSSPPLRRGLSGNAKQVARENIPSALDFDNKKNNENGTHVPHHR